MKIKERRTGWNPISDEVFAEEYAAFLRMGLSQNEIARAFRMSVDTLKHRISRSRSLGGNH